MEGLFTQKASHALARCPEIAGALGHTYVGSEHLLLALSEEEDAVASHFLEEKSAYSEKLYHVLEEFSGVGSPTEVSAADMTPRLRHIIEKAGELSRSEGSRLGTEHLLRAVLAERGSVADQLLRAVSVDTAALEKDLRLYEEKKRSGGVTKYLSPIEKLPYLGKYGRDLNRLAAEGKRDPLIGREAEMNELIRILTRRTKNNPCLIGEPGVGKSAIVEGLAARIFEGCVPDALKGRTVILLDLAAMVAGAKYRGEFEDRLKGVLEEVSGKPSLLLFIDEMHTLIGAGAAEGAVDASNILKPALARGELQLIGATTLKEYRLHVEKDAALCRRFREIVVEEPSVKESIEILRGLRERYEAHHGLLLSDEAITAAVTLSARYLHDRYLPDKAIDLVDEAASEMRLSRAMSEGTVTSKERLCRAIGAEKLSAIARDDFERAAHLRDKERGLKEEIRLAREARKELPEENVVRAHHIAEALSARTGLLTSYLSESEEEKLLRLEEELGRRIIGQREAIEAVARAVRRGRIRMEDVHRPSCFLLLGEPGVGKTALCRTLASVLFGSEEALLRFDMSEYMEKHSVARLIGAPPGYVGYGEGGQLTERIRRHPYAVLLFDEIEKAHPDVSSILLRVMEDGTLTDSEGRATDFSGVILIMTANLGARECAERHPLGFASQKDLLFEEEIRKKALSDAFRPEFINRLDEIIVFKPLDRQTLTEIARQRLASLAEGAETRGVSVEIDGAVAEALADICLRSGSGARPLSRAIVKYIEDPISLFFLSRHKGEPLSVTVGVKEGVPFAERKN